MKTRTDEKKPVERQLFAPTIADIFEKPTEYFLEAEMPGVGKDGLEVSVHGNELILTGHRTDQELPGEAFYQESNRLDFRRVFELDPSIDTSRITAKIDQGILRLSLPKTEAVQPRKIAVE